MPDPAEHLRAKLAQLRAQLDASSNVAPETRALLDEALVDAEAIVRSGRRDDTLAHRLGAAASGFEGQHPTLAGAVGSVIDALSRMGI